jgi:hypothetical protein
VSGQGKPTGRPTLTTTTKAIKATEKAQRPTDTDVQAFVTRNPIFEVTLAPSLGRLWQRVSLLTMLSLMLMLSLNSRGRATVSSMQSEPGVKYDL